MSPARQDPVTSAAGGPSVRTTAAVRGSRPSPVSRAVAEGAASLDALPQQPARPGPDPRAQRAKSDPNPVRILLGLVGLASASAFTTAMLPSILPVPAAAVQTANAAPAVPAPQPSVIHITKVIQLAPGQSAPPNSSVQIAPAPTPIVQIVTVTRQSGRP